MTERGRLARTGGNTERGFQSKKIGHELSSLDDGQDTYGNAFFTCVKVGSKAKETKMIIEMLKKDDNIPAPFKVMTKEEKHNRFLKQREKDREYRKMVEQESKKYYRFHSQNGS